MGLLKALFYCLMRANIHIMRRMKNKKVFNIFKALGTFIMILAVCVSGVLLFHNYYYESIYVSGSSMYPTLNGGSGESTGSKVDFGIVDTHKSAKDNIKRFSIVSTYYPTDTDYIPGTNTLRKGAKKKIKRVIALPNETFKIEKGKLYIRHPLQAVGEYEYEYIPYTFKTNPEGEYDGKDIGPMTLKMNEYWVLGDNRSSSTDCHAIGKPITYENIHGVLVAIEGVGSLYIKEYRCKNCGKKFKNEVSLCPDCYNDIEPVYDIKNKQYHWPKYF